jgi:L-iditol 2-dehydrogenase
MKAAVLHGREDLRVEEITARALQADEVRVSIGAALTCGTDLKVFKRGYHAKMLTPPSVFGHEMAGTISEVTPGAATLGWAVGDRVVAANSAPCGDCFFCRQGQEHLCDDLRFLNGAYAESIVIPGRFARVNLLRLKPTTAFLDAALTEPLACVVQGIQDCGLRTGQRVLVLGAGPIGLMFLVLARHAGCEVTVLGRAGNRLEKARKLGASRVVANDQAEAIPPALLEGQMFDVAIEAIGKASSWQAAVAFVRKGGLVHFFGGCPAGTRITLDADLLHYSGLTLRASFHHTPRTIRRALELIESGVVSATDFVDGECALSDLPTLFREMSAGNHAVKTRVNVGE